MLLAKAESATAHCYYALALKCQGQNQWGKHQEILADIAKKEYAHNRQLLLLLRGESVVDDFVGLIAKESPSQRPGWSPSNRYSLGLSGCWAWRILFGYASLLDMPEPQAMAVVGLIEGLHTRLYQALARDSSGEARHVFAKIANDELIHEIAIAGVHPLNWLAIRAFILLPLACLVFVAIDWPALSRKNS
jgi:hypothetical protein